MLNSQGRPLRAAPIVVLFLACAACLVAAAGAAGAQAAQPVPGFNALHAEGQPPLSAERILEEQLNGLPVEELERFVRTLDAESRQLLPPADLRAMIFEGEGVRWGELGRRLLYAFTGEVALNISLLGQLVIVGVFCALLRSVASSLGGSEAGDVAFLLCLFVLLFISVQAFRTAVQLAASTLDQMVDFMHAILPLLAALLAAAGAVTTAAIFHPFLYVTVTAIAMLVRGLLFPLVFVMAGLAVLGSLSRDFPLRQMAGLLRTGSMILLGLSFLVFFAVMHARGAIAPVTDGLALRTAKFLTGAFIPVVGGRLADALDVVIGGSVLIKNAVGVFGMGAIAVITAFPIVKIFSILTVFRVATALVEPITDSRLVDAMSGLSTCLTLLLAGLITAALMFFVGITVVIGVGNTAAFLR